MLAAGKAYEARLKELAPAIQAALKGGNAAKVKHMVAAILMNVVNFFLNIALIFGKWRPYPTLCACLLFAFTDALQVRLQGVALPGIGVIPVQFVEALPYLLTVLLLAGFVGTARAPKALGRPFVKTR